MVVSNTPEVNDDRLRNPGYGSSFLNRLGEAFMEEGIGLIKRKENGDSLTASADFWSPENWQTKEREKKDRDAARPILPDPNTLMSGPRLAHANGNVTRPRGKYL
ncbi:hypothetical protein Ancab_033937 [Ancistrocladus abbreviatus]